MGSRTELLIYILDKINLSGMQKVTKALKEIQDGSGKLKAVFKADFEASKKAVEIFLAPLKAAAVPAIAAVTTAFGLAVKAVREFAGQELGEQDVISALMAMGQYTDQYKERIVQLADTYQTTTGIADDMWLKAMGQLTRFGMNAANVDKVSTALKNLTGLMDGNIDGATLALSKALQGEFDAFSRFGIIVKNSGDDVKDLDTLISQINTKGQGLLEGRADTLVGKWTSLKNQVNEVFEAVGKRLNEGLNIGAAVESAKGMLATLTSAVQSGGLGDLIAEGGKKLREHIEKAVEWAQKIATAIKDSGKPVEQVFSDALRAAATVFLDAIVAGLQASLEIWKLIGKTIASTFKEDLLKINFPGLGGFGGSNRNAWASYNAKSLPDDKAAQIMVDNGLVTKDEATNPVFKGMWSQNLSTAASEGLLPSGSAAKLGASLSSAEVTDAFTKFKTAVTDIATNLGKEVKTAVETAAGMKDGKSAAPEKSTITIQGSDGKEVTIALDEYIKQYQDIEKKMVEAAEAGTKAADGVSKSGDDIKKSTDAAIKAALESATSAEKSSDAAVEAHEKVTSALDRATTAADTAAQAAVTAQSTLDRALVIMVKLAQMQSNNSFRIGEVEGQIRNMRA